MQRNVICQYWVLEMCSLPMADELPSFQFLDINENRQMSFRVLIQHDISISYQA